MAARTGKPFHDDRTREKIKTSQLVNRLTDHVFDRCEMSKTQVSAALGLLKKTLPDLSTVSMDATYSGDVTIKVITGIDDGNNG